MLPLFCYCQLDNFAWGTRGIDASETTGQDCKDAVEKKPYEVGSEAHSHLHYSMLKPILRLCLS